MRIVAWVLLCLSLTGGVFGCRTHSSDSNLRSEDDIRGDIHWNSSSGKWAITCRDGRVHNGQRSTLVSTKELRTACEDLDTSGSPTPGPDGGNQWDISQRCPNRPAAVKALSIAISPDWLAELGANPVLANQQVCVVFLAKFSQLLASSPDLAASLTGAASGSPMLVLVGKATAPVQFDADTQMLTIPWKLDDAAVDAMADKMTAGGAKLCGEDGKRLRGACWYTGWYNQGCTETCTRVGKMYDDKTATVAGTSGTLEACKAIGEAFGAVYRTGSFSCHPIGCFQWNLGQNTKFVDQCYGATNASAGGPISPFGGNAQYEIYRYCACKSR